MTGDEVERDQQGDVAAGLARRLVAVGVGQRQTRRRQGRADSLEEASRSPA